MYTHYMNAYFVLNTFYSEHSLRMCISSIRDSDSFDLSTLFCIVYNNTDDGDVTAFQNNIIIVLIYTYIYIYLLFYLIAVSLERSCIYK